MGPLHLSVGISAWGRKQLAAYSQGVLPRHQPRFSILAGLRELPLGLGLPGLLDTFSHCDFLLLRLQGTPEACFVYSFLGCAQLNHNRVMLHAPTLCAAGCCVLQDSRLTKGMLVCQRVHSARGRPCAAFRGTATGLPVLERRAFEPPPSLSQPAPARPVTPRPEEPSFEELYTQTGARAVQPVHDHGAWVALWPPLGCGSGAGGDWGWRKVHAWAFLGYIIPSGSLLPQPRADPAPCNAQESHWARAASPRATRWWKRPRAAPTAPSSCPSPGRGSRPTRPARSSTRRCAAGGRSGAAFAGRREAPARTGFGGAAAAGPGAALQHHY